MISREQLENIIGELGNFSLPYVNEDFLLARVVLEVRNSDGVALMGVLHRSLCDQGIPGCFVDGAISEALNQGFLVLAGKHLVEP